MYDSTTTTCSSSPLPSRPPPPPPQPFDSDDISIFLHHLLHSSSKPPPPQPHPPPSPLSLPHLFSHDHNPVNSSATDSSSFLSSSALYLPTLNGTHDSVTVSVKRRRFPSDHNNNDLDDFDCESEEGFEASDGNVNPAPAPTRCSSKRSRAAEVHNLSEKRRRSRINEKMKALQNLIPNSNKTDKASMLDEAIEYLKQLQLQVQMLSMRNGFSLHPMYLPGVVQPLQLPQMRMGFSEGGLPPNINIGRDSLPVHQESSSQTSFGLSNQCTTSNQPMVIPNMKNISGSEASYGLDSSVPVNQEPFQLTSLAAEEMYKEHMLAQQKLYIGQSSRNPSENKMKAIAAASLPFDARIPVMEHPSSLEARGLDRDRSQDILPKDVDNSHILVPHLHRQE